MKLSDAIKRIEELEKRVRELESRPAQIVTVPVPYYAQPQYPGYSPFPSWPVITCGSTIGGYGIIS